jgi:hypothetical protein
VPKELLPEVKLWIAEHRRLRRLTQEITALSLAQVQSHVAERRRQAGRS